MKQASRSGSVFELVKDSVELSHLGTRLFIKFVRSIAIKMFLMLSFIFIFLQVIRNFKSSRAMFKKSIVTVRRNDLQLRVK